MKWMLWNDGVDMAEFGMLHVRTAIVNGRLDPYSGHHSSPADLTPGLDLTAIDTRKCLGQRFN
jgi:hypothetical protein